MWNPSFLPDQSIYTAGGDRFFNASLAQIEYLASARSVLSFSGSFGLLRFREPGLVENNSLSLTAGYNYAVTRRDTFSVNYGFSALRFIGAESHLDNHMVSLAYGRRLTGKMSFSISGGPQFIIVRTPVAGNRTSTDLFARARVEYKLGRNRLNTSYTHYTSNGSGIFLGARTDRFDGSYSRRLTRNWSWSIGPGYSRNARLNNGQAITNDSVYNTMYGHTSIGRELGRYTSVAFTYSAYRQWSNSTDATGSVRSSSFLRHLFGASLTWHGSRLGLD